MCERNRFIHTDFTILLAQIKKKYTRTKKIEEMPVIYSRRFLIYLIRGIDKYAL